MKQRVSKSLLTACCVSLFVSCLLLWGASIWKLPQIGISVSIDSEGRNVVAKLDPYGQAINDDVRIGDIILQLNNIRIHQYWLENPLSSKLLRIENIHNALLKNPETFQFTAHQFATAWGDDIPTNILFMQLYLPLVAFILFGSILILLLWKQWQQQNALSFINLLLIVGTIYLAAVASTVQQKSAVFFLIATLPIIPILSVAFIERYFARQSLPFMNKIMMYICIVCAAVAVCCSLLYLQLDAIPNTYILPARRVYYILVLLIFIGCLFHPLLYYWRYRKTVHQSSYIIIIGAHMIVFFPVIAIAILPQLIQSTYWIAPSYSLLLVFLLPLIYYYFVDPQVDQRFMLTRFKYYTVLAIIPAFILATFITVIFLHTDRPLWHIWILSFSFIDLGMTLLLYIKDEVDQQYRPRFFKDMHRYQQSLDNITQQSQQVMTVEQLAQMLQQEISAVIPVEHVHLIYIHTDQCTIIGEHTRYNMEQLAALQPLSDVKQGEIIRLPNSIAIALGKRNTDDCLLLVGAKQNKIRFNNEELRWLQTIANYATIVLENLYLVQGLQAEMEVEINKQHLSSTWVSRLLFALSEKERRKLAADLHDTVLQEQVVLFRKIEALTSDKQLPTCLLQSLDEMKQSTLNITKLIRETCNELRPPLLKEMGIRDAVRALVHHYQQTVPFQIQYASSAIPFELHEEEITAIYRIVQELLHNAVKHAHATIVELHIWAEKDHGTININYRDDGVGFQVDQFEESFHHMGLSGMRERVASLEGTMTITSQINIGLQIAITIPAMMAEQYEGEGESDDSSVISR